MCRNIRTLANFEPPATPDEIRASALQFVRKLSGTSRPSKVNQAVFDRAVEDVTEAATRLVRSLTTSARPRSRDEEARKARARGAARMAREGRGAAGRPRGEAEGERGQAADGSSGRT